MKRPSLKRHSGLIAGFAISTIILFFIARNLEWNKIQSILARAGSRWPLLAAAGLAYLASFLFRGFRYRLILLPVGEVTRRTSIAVVLTGFMSNNLLPARMGEAVRAWAMSRVSKISGFSALGAVVCERVLDGIVLLGILAIGLSSGIFNSGADLTVIHRAAKYGTMLIIFIAGVLLFARLAPGTVKSMLRGIIAPFPEKAGKKMMDFSVSMLDSLAFLRFDMAMMRIVVFSIAVWLCEGTALMLVMKAFGFAFSAVAAGLVLAIVNFSIAVPSMPGYLGPFEAGILFGTGLLAGSSPDVFAASTAAAIILHAIQYAIATIGGLASANALGITWRQVTNRNQAMNPKTTSDLH